MAVLKTLIFEECVLKLGVLRAGVFGEEDAVLETFNVVNGADNVVNSTDNVVATIAT